MSGAANFLKHIPRPPVKILRKSEGREWGVGSVMVDFRVFGAPRFSVQRPQTL